MEKAPWVESLRPLCREACDVAGFGAPAETVVFYVARWCQKETGAAEPDLAVLGDAHLADVAARVVHNLEEDGVRVERLVAGDASAWTELRHLLYSSACPRVGGAAAEYADEALQKIAVVLLTGTAPSGVAERRAAGGVEGPRNEYVFVSPFTHWARRVVINLIVDEGRRRARERVAAAPHASHKPPSLDTATLERAHAALPGLLEAIGELPPVQRSVMVWTLGRTDLDLAVTEWLHELAPELFAHADGPQGDCSGADAAVSVSSDGDIAERLGTTPRLVAANRSAARCKLAARDPLWRLLLDVLLPHRSTRSPQEGDDDG